MSNISINVPPTARTHQGQAIANHARRVANWVRRRIVIAQTTRLLHDLPDWLLADMGIQRSEIDEIVPRRLNHAGEPQGPYPF